MKKLRGVLPNDTSIVLKIISSKEKLDSWDLISAFRLQFLISRILLKMKVDDMQFPGSTEAEMISTCCSHLQHQPLSLGCNSPSLTPTMSLTCSLWAVVWLVDQEAHVFLCQHHLRELPSSQGPEVERE